MGIDVDEARRALRCPVETQLLEEESVKDQKLLIGFLALGQTGTDGFRPALQDALRPLGREIRLQGLGQVERCPEGAERAPARIHLLLEFAPDAIDRLHG